MKYRLALDVGTNSLGWAVLPLDANNKPKAIAKLGVRIFSSGRDPKTGASLAVKRREARAQRRQRDRYLKRKNSLIQVLIDLGFFPKDKQARKALAKEDPYLLRHLGVSQELSPEKVARAFFHLNERRGFKSNRKSDTKSDDTGAIKTAIKELNEKLKNETTIAGHTYEEPTLGQWLYSRRLANQTTRAKLPKDKTKKTSVGYEFYADRAMVEKEFERIWATQKVFNPELYSENAYRQIKETIFFQRPLKPSDDLIGRCTLLPDEKRAPKALPSTQLSRILQEVNNLKLVTSTYEVSELTLEMKRHLSKMLLDKKEVTFKSMRRELSKLSENVEYTTFNLEDVKRTSLKGDETGYLLKSGLGSKWSEFSLELKDSIVEILLNAQTDIEVETALLPLGLDTSEIAKIKDIALPAGYGNLSKKVNQQIIPFLLEGDLYHIAVEKAGLGSHSCLSPTEKLSKLPYYGEILTSSVSFGKPGSKLEEQKYGKIGNPTVHVALNQIRKIVNALIEKYGVPNDIVVEVTRSLKNNEYVRTSINREQAKNQESNKKMLEEYAEMVGKEGLQLSTSERVTALEKMKLYAEMQDRKQTPVCVYSGRTISKVQLFSEEVEIDHIFPWSQSLDDSLANKVLCFSVENRNKSNQSPSEAFGESKELYDEIVARAFSLFGKEKAIRFTKDGYTLWLKDNNDFLARALNDTAYIARITRSYLACLVEDHKILCSPGRLTAMIRRHLGLDSLLSVEGVKNRGDHRHHALDAAVIGVMDKNFLKTMATLHGGGFNMQKGMSRFKPPFPTYREHVKRALSEVVVSHKPNYGYQGQFALETAFKLIDASANKIYRRTDPTKYKEGDPKGKEETANSLMKLVSSNERHKRGPNGELLPYVAYELGSNYCIDVVRKNGKIEEEVVSTKKAYEVVQKQGESALYKRTSSLLSGSPLLDCIRKGDHYEQKGVIYVVVKISKGKVALVPHCDGNDAANRIETSKSASKLLAEFIKVSVSEIGKVSKKGKL